MIDDGLEAELCLLGNQQIHFFTHHKPLSYILNPVINSGGTGRPSLVIKVDLNHTKGARL